MSTDYKALCEELTTTLEYTWDGRRPKVIQELIERARAALAQPEPARQPMPVPGDAEGLAEVFWGRYDQPEPVAPTDEEIEEWADAATEVPLEEMDPEIHGWRRCFTAKEFNETIRAALAHWGRQ